MKIEQESFRKIKGLLAPTGNIEQYNITHDIASTVRPVHRDFYYKFPSLATNFVMDSALIFTIQYSAFFCLLLSVGGRFFRNYFYFLSI